MITYKQVKNRSIDTQYRDLLKLIKKEGEEEKTQLESRAQSIFGHQMRFSLENGFPIISERDLVSGKRSVFHQALGELFAFLHGVRTQKELEKFGCYWWKDWITPKKCAKRELPPGDLGDGSYGPAWCNFPTKDGGVFNQIQKNIIEQIKELPHLRTLFVSPWIPQYIGRGKGKIQKVVVVPCHGWFHVKVNKGTNKLSLHHFQRSADVPVGLVGNMIQYAALTMMLAQVTGYEAKELVYTISDAHIYVPKQTEDVDKMLLTAPQTFPTVKINPTIKNLLSFRQEHFEVSDYYPELSRRRIWTPI